uniref:Uncharacterized protein n=1 Tax=viral metagenome TaxID=1070528 RepID=A0A6M3LW24_9ZZZZ
MTTIKGDRECRECGNVIESDNDSEYCWACIDNEEQDNERD